MRNYDYFLHSIKNRTMLLKFIVLYLQKTKLYVNRMTNYLDQWRMHVLSEMNTEVSKCRPLWDVLEGIKHLLCGHILNPFVCTIKNKTINHFNNK